MNSYIRWVAFASSLYIRYNSNNMAADVVNSTYE
jgi:hypothetical protein